MAITRQFVLNLPTAAGRYPLTTRYSCYSVTVWNSPLLFLLMGSGSWNLGWGLCFSGIEDFLYQQD